jgi:hypothetical protein
VKRWGESHPKQKGFKMAKSVKVVLTLVDAQGIEWVATETTETKAKALVKAYSNAGVILTAKFSAVA